MKTTLRLSLAAFGLATCNLSAATLHVSLLSTNPVPPYTNWVTAATNIQDAVDAAHAGDTVLVTNGVYAVGGRGMGESEYNQSRVVVTNAIRLESVNGPLVTIIEGASEYGAEVRCVYLGTNAVLSGFTLTNGYSRGPGFPGGGVFSEPSGIVTNCTVSGNAAWGSAPHPCGGRGGGAYGGTLYNCTLTGNSAGGGGGAHSSTLYNCTLTGNSTHCVAGGAVYGATLYNCTITGNWADYGWGCGAVDSTLYNCTVTDNDGSGALASTLYNCTLTGNSAREEYYSGGGALDSTLYNCTVTGNDRNGVGTLFVGSTVFNSIVYGNTNANYAEGTVLNYCLTTPLPTNGIGNIAADPGFVNAAAGDYHLLPDSPCIDAGTNLLALITTDLDGEFRPWDGNRDGVAAFDIGAYEFRPSPVTLYVSLASTTPVPPYITWATAATNIQDAVDVSKAGDTVLVTNGVYAAGSRDGNRVSITNAIRLESVIGPLVTTIVGLATDPHDMRRCVYLGSNAVLSGFTLTNGMGYGAGGVFSEPSGVVTNCVLTGSTAFERGGCGGAGGGAYGGNLYNCTLTGNSAGAGGGAYGSTLYNCTLTDNHVWCGSGGGASGSTLYNCTLTGNSAWDGGGASRSTLYNCTLTGNQAGDSGNWFGGGAYESTLYNCTLTGNITYGDGGGAGGSTLYNCTLTGNSANLGGGGASGCILYNCTVTGNDGGGVGVNLFWWAVGSTLYNSIVYYNFGGNYAEGTTLNYCCTTPLPTNGVGNITGPPLFMDWAAEDFRLREESPCIDAGTNLMGFPIKVWRYVPEVGFDWVIVGHITDPTDMLGNTRFIDGNFDGTVAWDMGAYEFNSFRPPRFTSGPRLTANGWQLNITGAADQWVRLQRSSDLRNWEDVPLWPQANPFFMESEGVRQVHDGDMGQQKMFYRAVVE